MIILSIDNNNSVIIIFLKAIIIFVFLSIIYLSEISFHRYNYEYIIENLVKDCLSNIINISIYIPYFSHTEQYAILLYCLFLAIKIR